MRRDIIGLDRKLELDWLDAAAWRVSQDQRQAQIRAELWELLERHVAGESLGSARGKTVTILSKIWLSPSPKVRELRDRASRLLAEVQPDERVALHLAMMACAYPFFFETLDILGRLTAFEPDVTLRRVQHRLVELWGDRSTVRRSSQRIVRTLVNWEILDEHADEIGRYQRTKPRVVGPHTSLIWLEALLYTLDEAPMRLATALSHPSSFALELNLDESMVRKAPQFELYRQGSWETFVELRR